MLLSVSCVVSAQQNNVGINTDFPTARLEIHTNGNTISTLGLRLRDSGNKSIFNMHDNGYLGVNTESPEAVLHILGNTAGNDLLIQKTTTTTSYAGITYTPNFRHMKYQPAGNYNNANVGGQLILFDMGGANASNTVSHGIYLIPANATVPAGLYLGSNRFNGFSLNRLPTTDLDVGGSIRLREYPTAITAGSSCSGRSGEMLYYKGHFYGCNNSNVWRQLDN